MEIDIDSGVHNYKLKGYTTNTEFMRSSTLMMLFVNNRLVTHEGNIIIQLKFIDPSSLGRV